MSQICFRCNCEIKYKKCLVRCSETNRLFHGYCYKKYLISLKKQSIASDLSPSHTLQNTTVNLTGNHSDSDIVETLRLDDSKFSDSESSDKNLSSSFDALHAEGQIEGDKIDFDLTMSTDSGIMNNSSDLDNLVPPSTPVAPKLPDDWGIFDDNKKQEFMMLKILSTENLVQSTQTFIAHLALASNKNSASIRKHEVKILAMEKKIEANSNKIEKMKSKASVPYTSEMLIDKVPKDLIAFLDKNPSCSPNGNVPIVEITQRLMSRLKLKDLISDILEVTEFPRKGTDAEKFVSLKVKFKSGPVRDLVLDKKRNLGNLDLSHIFDNLGSESIIFFNELLPSYTFKLLMAARTRKKAVGWDGPIWAHANNVFVKSNITKQILCIVDEEDLGQIK